MSLPTHTQDDRLNVHEAAGTSQNGFDRISLDLDEGGNLLGTRRHDLCTALAAVRDGWLFALRAKHRSILLHEQLCGAFFTKA